MAMLSDRQLEAVRSRFRIFQRKIYLNSCSQGALSDAVEQAVVENLASWHEQGSPWELWIEKYEAARNLFARFIGAEADEVAVVPSASAAVNALASALDFTTRNKVLLGDFEFPTMGHIWLAQEKRGARVEFLIAEKDRLPSRMYAVRLDDRTAIVPLTHVCFMNGFRSDVRTIADLAHKSGALVLLDDYQDCGTRPVNVKTLGVDFYVSGTLKYLLGSAGLAFLYVRRELIESLIPTISGWFAQRNPFAFDVRHLDLSPTARRFESGTPPIPSIYPSAAGIELLTEIGLENVEAQVRRLTQAMMAGARELGIRVKTPPDSVGPLVVLQSRDVLTILAKLSEKGIVASGRHDGLRIAFHIYNSLDDVRAVLDVLEGNLPLMVGEGTAV